jgi:hypothetical protein
MAMRTYLTVRRANTNIGHVRNLRNLLALAARVPTVLSQGSGLLHDPYKYYS